MKKLSNNEIKILKKLKDKKYRKAEGLFLVEGTKLCLEVLNSNYEIQTTITTDEFKYNDFPNVCVIDYDVLKSICTTETPQDIVCVCRIPRSIEQSPNGNSLILDNLQDPGNIGTLIRSAMAFGFKDIYFIDCPDIYSEKVIRATMGGIFKINPHIVSREYVIENKKDICDILLGTTLNAQNLNKICLPKGRISVIIGNEGKGMSPTLISACDMSVTLPMSGEVESLNAGVAGSIMMYEIFKGEI